MILKIGDSKIIMNIPNRYTLVFLSKLNKKIINLCSIQQLLTHLMTMMLVIGFKNGRFKLWIRISLLIILIFIISMK